MKNQVYDVEVTDENGTRYLPAYTCGHCTSIILMRPDRLRERRTCLRCGRWICEKSEICLTHCTPMHAMAADHFEDAGEYGLYVPAIMRGITKKDDADKLVTLGE